MRWLTIALAVLALIIIPFVLFEDRFNAAADALLRRDASRWYTATAVAGLLAADVFLPIPSSIVAAASGVALGFARGALAVWIGMTLSCGLGYAFGARAANAATRFIGDAGMARARFLASRYGDYALVLCRPVPVLAEASVIFAGIVRRPIGRFASLTSWANAGVAMGYAAIGAYSMRVDSFLLAFLGAMVVPAIAMLAGRVWLRAR
jgi:membrane protein DedA with SNARE-associated domain